MDAFIKAIAYYLPEKIVTNEDLVAEFPEWTVEKIAGKIGVSQRHVAAENETAGDMAVKAALRLFEEQGVTKEDIDFVILCTQSPDYFLPSTACIIQHQLGLSTSCGAFDIDLGCSGYEYGLAVAQGLIAASIAKNVLLLTSETYNKHIHIDDKGNRTIFGDGAAATLIARDGFARIKRFSLGTDGRGAESLIHKNGGWRNPGKTSDQDDYLFMDGKAIFDFTADAVPTMVDDVLEKNCLTLPEIDLFVFHQANQYMINYLRKLIGIDRDKFYICLDKVGNTVSSTIPIALVEAMKENRLMGNVLLAGFGVGFSYGAVVLECLK